MTSSVGSVKSDVVTSPVGKEPRYSHEKQTRIATTRTTTNDIRIRTEPTVDKESDTIQEPEFGCERK